MIIELAAGKHELLERDDFARLKLRAPSGWSATDIERALPFEAACSPEHVWIKEADLRDLIVFAGGNPTPLSGMVEKAKKYGFYDEANGTVRVHVEYY